MHDLETLPPTEHCTSHVHAVVSQQSDKLGRRSSARRPCADPAINSQNESWKLNHRRGQGEREEEGDRECAHALDSVHSASLTFEHEAVFRSDEASKEIGCKGRLKTLTSCATWALIIQNRLHS